MENQYLKTFEKFETIMKEIIPIKYFKGTDFERVEKEDNRIVMACGIADVVGTGVVVDFENSYIQFSYCEKEFDRAVLSKPVFFNEFNIDGWFENNLRDYLDYLKSNVPIFSNFVLK